MVIPPDIEVQILRYYHAEKWTVGTIARQLHVHHSVVRRVLAQAGLPRIGPPPRPVNAGAKMHRLAGAKIHQRGVNAGAKMHQ